MLLLTFLALTQSTFAQTGDFNEKGNVFFAVSLIVLLGIFGYLFWMDIKLSKWKKQKQDEE